MGKDSKRAVINEAVEALEVRLIGADGQQVGVVKTTEALAMAQEESLDLVQIAGDSNPVVCKIMDYGKHLFDIKKKRAASRKKQKQTQVKEMKFRPGTEDGDYQVKLRNLTRFLEAGDKAKVTLRFRGREMAHQELGRELLERVAADIEAYGKIENIPKMEGRQMTMMIGPTSSK